LKNYVRVLRKIEREPAEAPQTSAAVRALERARRNRGKAILEESRAQVKEQNRKKREALPEPKKNVLPEETFRKKVPASITDAEPEVKETEQTQPLAAEQPATTTNGEAAHTNGNGAKKQKTKRDNYAHRPPISEVLRDIYDEK
jgi:hypothetical protein